MTFNFKLFVPLLLIVLIDALLFHFIDQVAQERIHYEEQLLIDQAQTHFDAQVNTQQWSASYGGVFVRPKPGQQPNPYLSDNILTTENNELLYKINPALLTRELSDHAKIAGFHFRITSRTPLNPSNAPDSFEREALEYLYETNASSYYRFDRRHRMFNFMGALVTKPDCIPCHTNQGYAEGNIRGGISIALDADDEISVMDQVRNRQQMQKAVIVVISLLIAALIYLTFKSSRETNRTKKLLQAVLDGENNFLVVADEHDIVLANKTLLNFLGYESFEAFQHENVDLGDYFETRDDERYLQANIGELSWLEYLLKYQVEHRLKVLISRGGEQRHFRPLAKEITVEGKRLFLIIFDEITRELNERKALKAIAETDPLTALPNRAKFDRVFEQHAGLAFASGEPLSVVFVDLDLFKAVNDTFGHQVGDNVLIAAATVLKSAVRQGDFVARWGGEEFVIILQATPIDQAVIIAEKVRAAFEAFAFHHGRVQTVSCGVSQYRRDETVEACLGRADKALYIAKTSGRNCVEMLV